MKVFPGSEGPMADWPEVAEVPGAGAALTDLGRTHRIALLTSAGESTEARVRQALGRVGLDRHFAPGTIVLARDIGLPKSDPAFYRGAVAKLGFRPEEAVMIGDNYENDVVAAKKAGLKAIWFSPAAARQVPQGGQRAAPGRSETAPGDAHDAVLTSLRDLPGLVRSLRRSGARARPSGCLPRPRR